ncbi:hypothetical protein AAVH_18937 [Aphelenchoides avenae]|nr:hypothetical protein AAVH_18937 [Aphelenchus avenae]
MSGSCYSKEMAAVESKTQKFNEVPAEDWVNVLLFAEGHDTASAALTNARFATIVTNNRVHLPVRDFFYLSVECNWPLCRLKWVEHMPFLIQSTEWEENFIASNKLDVLLPSSFVRHLAVHNFAPNERLLYIPSLERIGCLELNTLTSARLSEFNTRVTPDGCFSWSAFPNLVECQQVQWTTLLSQPLVRQNRD